MTENFKKIIALFMDRNYQFKIEYDSEGGGYFLTDNLKNRSWEIDDAMPFNEDDDGTVMFFSEKSKCEGLEVHHAGEAIYLLEHYNLIGE